MTDGLPKGLITNSEAISSDIKSIDYVAIEDIFRLWRVYTTNKTVLADDVGRRLENFFWRIWSNGRISSNIRGSQVALLFMGISEGAEIRTTPTQSPRSRRSYLEGEHRHRKPSGIEENPRSERLATQEKSPSKAPRKLSSSQERRRDTQRPPPILKKPKAGSPNYLPKTARILSPNTRKENEHDTEGESPVLSTQPTDTPSSLGLSTEYNAVTLGSSTARSGSGNESSEAEVQFSSAKGSSTIQRPVERAPQSDPSQRPGRKKAAFTANAAATKRRPAVLRRKSSQSSSNNTPKVPSPHSAAHGKVDLGSPPPLPSLGTLLDDVDLGPISPNTTSDTSTVKARSIIPTLLFNPRPTQSSRSASPRQPRHSQDQVQGRLATGISPSDTRYNEERAHQDWLVDRNFRSKFVERALPSENHGLASSHTHRAKSSAALAVPASYQAHGTMGSGKQAPGKLPGKEKAKITFMNKTLTSKALVASSEAIVDNNDNDDDDDDERGSQALSKTTSQLTLLLDRDRRVNEQEKRKKKQPPRRKPSS